MKQYLLLGVIVGFLLLGTLGSGKSDCRANYSEPTLVQYRIELDCEKVYAGEPIMINYVRYENLGNNKKLVYVPDMELTITGYDDNFDAIYYSKRYTYPDGAGVKFNPPSPGEYLIQAENVTEARFTVLERPEGYQEKTPTGLAIAEEPKPEEQVEPVIPWDQIDLMSGKKPDTESDPAVKILEETTSETISGYVQLLISLLLY